MNLYLSQSLTFEEDKIYFLSSEGVEQEVMMDWEHELMSASAACATQNGGDILEIGFGMGISAGYIQSHSIASHTIVEIHPDVIPHALNWALDKPNVTIITGSWYDNLDNLSTYNGVFFDPYADPHYKYFFPTLPQFMKSGGVATWWNPTGNNSGLVEFEVEFQEFDVTPPPNSYYSYNKYYLPKLQF
jgi:type IV protein arginine methyltransferase